MNLLVGHAHSLALGLNVFSSPQLGCFRACGKMLLVFVFFVVFLVWCKGDL